MNVCMNVIRTYHVRHSVIIMWHASVSCLCNLSNCNCIIALQNWVWSITLSFLLCQSCQDISLIDKLKGHCQVCQKFSLPVLLFLERALSFTWYPPNNVGVGNLVLYITCIYSICILVYGCDSMNAKCCHSLKTLLACSSAKLFSLKNLHLVSCSNLFSGRSFSETVLSWCCQLKLLSHVVRVIMLFTSLRSVIKVTSYWTGRWKAVVFITDPETYLTINKWS